MNNLIPLPEPGGGQAITQTDGRLAWEIAAQISDVPTILKRYDMSVHDLKGKLKDPMFRAAIREAKTIWKSDLNIQQRIRLKAAFLVEDSLMDIFAIIKNEQMTASTKLEAFEKLMKTADMGPTSKKNDAGGGTGHFKINIILGDSPEQKVTIDAIPQESVSTAE